MNTKELIASMTREDFLLREEKRKQVFEPTPDEIQEIQEKKIKNKEAAVLPYLSGKNFSINREIGGISRQSYLLSYLSLNRDKYKSLLGTPECHANLEDFAAQYMVSNASDSDSYNTELYEKFLDFVLKYDLTI